MDFDRKGSNELENAVQSPVDARRVQDLADDAVARTRARFPDSDLHNDEADAYRHALWSYTMTRELGPETAKEFGDAHEVGPVRNYEVGKPGPDEERLMDLHNNEVGRRLARDPKNQDRDPEEVVLETLRDGRLQTEPFVLSK